MSDFISFSRAHGIEIIPKDFFPCDKIRRCGTTDKPRSLNGAYLWDGERGFVFNWSEDAKAKWFEDAHAKRWTDEEKTAWLAKRKLSQADQDKRHAQAAAKAATMLKAAKPASHNYLHLKGFGDTLGLVADTVQIWSHETHAMETIESVLLIPMHTLSGAIAGLQQIWWDGSSYQKQMLSGTRARGAVHCLGDKRANEFALVEGYATGLSVLAALRSIGLRCSVLVCFSAKNMELVASQVGGRKWCFADNDALKTNQGEQSAKATGLPYCMSDIPGFDANDVHQKLGLMKVCQHIMQVRHAGG